MTNEELIEVLRTITNGTFEMPGISTLMGWKEIYDDKGRLVTTDPNWLDYNVNINGIDYHVTKKGWTVCIWKPEYNHLASYTRLIGRDLYLQGHPGLLVVYDSTPDYVKEYWKNNTLSY